MFSRRARAGVEEQGGPQSLVYGVQLLEPHYILPEMPGVNLQGMHEQKAGAAI